MTTKKTTKKERKYSICLSYIASSINMELDNTIILPIKKIGCTFAGSGFSLIGGERDLVFKVPSSKVGKVLDFAVKENLDFDIYVTTKQGK